MNSVIVWQSCDEWESVESSRIVDVFRNTFAGRKALLDTIIAEIASGDIEVVEDYDVMEQVSYRVLHGVPDGVNDLIRYGRAEVWRVK